MAPQFAVDLLHAGNPVGRAYQASSTALRRAFGARLTGASNRTGGLCKRSTANCGAAPAPQRLPEPIQANELRGRPELRQPPIAKARIGGRSRSEAARPARHHGPRAEEKNGAAPRNLAPDAYDCIMAKVETTTEYKTVEGVSLHPGEFPSDRSAQVCPQARRPALSIGQRQPANKPDRQFPNQRSPPLDFSLFSLLTTKAPYKVAGEAGRMRGDAKL